VKCDFDVTLPVDCELVPALLVRRRGGRKRAPAQRQDIGLENVEHFGRRTFIRCIKRQDFCAGNFLGQLPQRAFLSRHGKHAPAIPHGGFDNPAPYSSAPADHDHVLTRQGKHFVLLAPGRHICRPHV
jgi:hypothetical protein